MNGAELVKAYLVILPEESGVYRFFDREQKPLYVGKAKNLRKRVTYYTKRDLTARLKYMVSQIFSLEHTVTKTEGEALLLEAILIKNLQPRFNILLRDDKSFPYLRITTNHPAPQISRYRGKLLKEGKFFGPFASSKHLEQTIMEITKIFKLRTCSDEYFASRKTPCLLYQIQRCSAPCVDKITQPDYHTLVLQTLDFLSGKVTETLRALNIEMQLLSRDLKYEAAAILRDRIKALTHLQNNNSIISAQVKDLDVIAIASQQNIYCVQVFIYRGGKFLGNRVYFPKNTEESDNLEVLTTFIGQFYQTHLPPAEIALNLLLPSLADLAQALKQLHSIDIKISAPRHKSSKLVLVKHAEHNAESSLQERIKQTSKYSTYLAELKQLFDLSRDPKRVEVYDNSHIMGQHAIGVMIVATEEGFAKDQYRKFNIRGIKPDKLGGDDYQMLREVLERRLKYLAIEPANFPDLMIIDGGKGHLSVANEVITKFSKDIAVVAIAKGPNRNSGGEFFHRYNKPPFTLANDNPIMQYLQVLRDEAHGFAIRGHRHKRSKEYGAKKR